MATLSITIPDAQLPRVRVAFGHEVDGSWVNATAPEVQAWILRQVKQRVKDYEGTIAANAARATVEADVNAW